VYQQLAGITVPVIEAKLDEAPATPVPGGKEQ
jgi:hypothetical protein